MSELISPKDNKENIAVSNKIRFIQNLRDKLDPILQSFGFAITFLETEGLEAITYERTRPNLPGKDKINCHGTEDGQNHIYTTVVSGEGGLAFLTSLQELMPNYDLLQFPNNKRWEYQSIGQLGVVIDEITVIVSELLLPWFEKPKFGTRDKLSEKDLADWKVRLAIAANSYEALAKQRFGEENFAEAERFERMARLYREYVAKNR